jgi:hypothetical protein
VLNGNIALSIEIIADFRLPIANLWTKRRWLLKIDNRKPKIGNDFNRKSAMTGVIFRTWK